MRGSNRVSTASLQVSDIESNLLRPGELPSDAGGPFDADQNDRAASRAALVALLLLIFVLDVLMSLALCASLLLAGELAWGGAVLCVMGAQYAVTWLLVYRGTRRLERADGGAVVLDALALGPAGVLGLDCLMLAEATGLLPQLVDAPGSPRLLDFLALYKASRLLFAASCQAAPMLVLQLALLFAHAAPHRLLVLAALAVSAANVGLHAQRALQGAADAEMGVFEYLNILFELRLELPLHAIEANTCVPLAMRWRCSFCLALFNDSIVQS